MKKNKIDKTVEDVKQIVKALVNTAEDIHAQVFSAGTRCLKMPADLGPKSELRESLYEDQLELLSIPSLALVAIVSSPPLTLPKFWEVEKHRVSGTQSSQAGGSNAMLKQDHEVKVNKPEGLNKKTLVPFLFNSQVGTKGCYCFVCIMGRRLEKSLLVKLTSGEKEQNVGKGFPN